MEYAHSVIVTLKKKELMPIPIRITYNGNAKDYIHAVWIGDLPEKEYKEFQDFVLNWDEKTTGLFVDYDSVIGFVMIVETCSKTNTRWNISLSVVRTLTKHGRRHRKKHRKG